MTIKFGLNVEHGNLQRLLGDCEGVVFEPKRPNPSVGVLVLSGSSGQIASRRCELLANCGALAVSIRWFGGPGQSTGICEIPIERFISVFDEFENLGLEKLAVVGVSKGAEAALLLSCIDSRLDAAVAISPSAYVWANLGPGIDGVGHPYRSCWTFQGSPIPFIPYSDRWSPGTDVPPSYVGLYQLSLAEFSGDAEAARIRVEMAKTNLLLVAGGDDKLWPSNAFAREITLRRKRTGLDSAYVYLEGAGHRPILPGEDAPVPSSVRSYGGSEVADRLLGGMAWEAMTDLLKL